MRPWVLGDNLVETAGSDVTDGYSGRITDPITGAGMLNPNTDPAVTDIDSLTGTLALAGTDMSLGAMLRRQVHTNVINGDMAVGPPGGLDSLIVSDPKDAGYNPLPGFYLVPADDGSLTASVVAKTAAASGQVLQMVTGNTSVKGNLNQFVPIPRSQGQQYRAFPSAYIVHVSGPYGTFQFEYQYYDDDLNAIGSLVSTNVSAAAAEWKWDAGLVPTNATYIRLIIRGGNSAGAVIEVYEVRCAFLPAEAEVGLESIAANSVLIDNNEDNIVYAIIPANTMVVGSTYRIRAFGQVVSNSAAHTVTIRVRFGPSSPSGAIIASRAPTTTGSASSDPFSVEALVTCRSVGATGSLVGGIVIQGNATQPFNAAQFIGNSGSPVTVDTTVQNLLELTAVTSNAGTTVRFHVATIECIMAS